jgi:hypothetical protein
LRFITFQKALSLWKEKSNIVQKFCSLGHIFLKTTPLYFFLQIKLLYAIIFFFIKVY